MRSDSSECIGTWCGPLRSNSLVSYQNWRPLQCIQANTRNCFCAQSLYSSEVSQLSSNPDHPPFASPEQTESEVPLHCLGMSGAVVDGGHHLVPMRFHSHPVLTRKTASGSLVAQLHSLLSPCQTPLVTGQGLWPHMCVYPWTPFLLLHSGSEAYTSAPGFDGDEKCWQEQAQTQDQLAGSGCHGCHWLLRTQSSGLSLQQTEYRLLASGASSTCL